MGDAAGQRADRLEALGLPQTLLHLAAAGFFLRLRKRAPDRRPQPGQALFQDIIGGAIAERLDGQIFLERSRYENKRDFRRKLARQFQRVESVEMGQGAVGEDQVEVMLFCKSRIKFSRLSQRMRSQSRPSCSSNCWTSSQSAGESSR